MKLKPIADRVILREEENTKTTQSGIILTGCEKKNIYAKVVAVGNGTTDVKMEVKEGDKVIYSKHMAQEVELDGEKYIIVNHNDILAVIE